MSAPVGRVAKRLGLSPRHDARRAARDHGQPRRAAGRIEDATLFEQVPVRNHWGREI
ncbi:MAG: hypothetical protein OXL68_00345 [Paracoccaceae bacterium]|nr:hypothetical protein [Paracoccaceae bacterium]